jgi:hypothetical protein
MSHDLFPVMLMENADRGCTVKGLSNLKEWIITF